MRSELQAGRLRQGWGFAGCQLLNHGVQTPFEDWAANFVAGSRQFFGAEIEPEKLRTRYGILMRMLQLKTGDQIVVPNMPDVGSITLAKVKSGYRFDDSHFGKLHFHRNNNYDFIHVVDVDPDRTAVVGNTSSLVATVLASQFSTYRSAISFVRERNYRAVIGRLFR